MSRVKIEGSFGQFEKETVLSAIKDYETRIEEKIHERMLEKAEKIKKRENERSQGWWGRWWHGSKPMSLYDAIEYCESKRSAKETYYYESILESIEGNYDWIRTKLNKIRRLAENCNGNLFLSKEDADFIFR